MSSLNDIINNVNNLTGYRIPTASYVYTTGSVPQGSTVYVIPQQVDTSGDTISTQGIYPGGVIKADHVLRIINALSGVANNAIIISGSLTLPTIPDQEILYSDQGTVEGTDTVDGGTF